MVTIQTSETIRPALADLVGIAVDSLAPGPRDALLAEIAFLAVESSRGETLEGEAAPRP